MLRGQDSVPTNGKLVTTMSLDNFQFKQNQYHRLYFKYDENIHGSNLSSKNNGS